MSKLIRKEGIKWWVSNDQTLIESVYMLQLFSRHYGRDERYWKHHCKHIEIIEKLDLSDKLVLPFVQAIKGVRTVVLIEFDMERTMDVSPVILESFSDDNILAMLEEMEKESV